MCVCGWVGVFPAFSGFRFYLVVGLYTTLWYIFSFFLLRGGWQLFNAKLPSPLYPPRYETLR